MEDFRELIKLEWQPYKGVGGFGFGAHKIYQSYQLQPNIKIENEVAFIQPVKFKRTVDLVAPYFAGYQQHDAQEVLLFLLDGLHNGTDR